METKTNLELKYFCNDFGPIRKILSELGAMKVGVKKQIDYFYNLPSAEKSPPARLKLRTEGKKKTLIYYQRPNFSADPPTQAKVLLFPVKQKAIKDLLKKALGIKGIVEKTRELWSMENIVFNLDEVKGVGKVFEIEVTKLQESDNQVFEDLKSQFLPYLDKCITTSNIELVSQPEDYQSP